jgi:hypothetical protein
VVIASASLQPHIAWNVQELASTASWRRFVHAANIFLGSVKQLCLILKPGPHLKLKGLGPNSDRPAVQLGRSNLSAVRLISGLFPDRCQGQQSAAGRENHRTLDDNGRFLNAHETVLRRSGYVGLGGERSWPSFDPGDQVHLPQWRVVGIGVAGASRIRRDASTLPWLKLVKTKMSSTAPEPGREAKF